MSKELLIVCDEFPPAFAPRMGYLCKNLPAQGWHATIVTEKGELSSFDIDVKDTDVFAFEWLRSRGHVSRYVEWTFKFMLTLLFDYKSHWLYRQSLCVLRDKHFDAVLCSTYNAFPMRVAMWHAKRLGVGLTCDIRDLAEQGKQDVFRLHQVKGALGGLIGRIVDSVNKKRRNSVLRQSSAIISVSPWHVDFLTHYQRKSFLVYNGYDERLFYPRATKCDTFKIVYTGRMMDREIRDPGLLFEALRELKPVCEKMEVEWWCDHHTEQMIRDLSERYGVSDRMRYQGFGNHNDMPRVLNEASVVLVLSNKTDNNQPRGVMTTKYFEALGCERPILLVRSDEAELSHHIQWMGAGVACVSKEEVIAFLHDKYDEWKRNGVTRVNYLQDKSVYSRNNEAKQFVEILESVIHTDSHI